MNQVLLAMMLYNFAMIWEGHGSKLNFVSLVLCSVAFFGRLSLLVRKNPSSEGVKFWRRLGVFLFGGFICGKCGDARVRFGGRWMPVFTCPTCHQFYFLSPDSKMQVKRMWRLVWKPRR